MKILVVEDSEARLDFFREVFADCQLAFASTSRDAAALLDSDVYDLIFLDMDLDDGIGRGLEVARSLQKTKNFFCDVIVHSMNCSIATQVPRVLPGTQLIPIAEMRRIFELDGKEALFAIIFGQPYF